MLKQDQYSCISQESWKLAHGYKGPTATGSVCVNVHPDMFSHSLLFPGMDLLQLKAKREAARQDCEAGAAIATHMLTALQYGPTLCFWLHWETLSLRFQLKHACF